MVSFSNGSLPTEVTYKRPLENGCMPNFKPRKVSAVRDFPPGCGPDAVPMISRSEELCSSEAAGATEIVASLELTNTVVECQPCEEGSSSTSLSFQHWVDGSTNASVTQAASESLMEKAKESATISKNLAMEVGYVETKGEAESHGREAVNNPVELERDEQLGSYVGNVETTVINGLPDEVQGVPLNADDSIGKNLMLGNPLMFSATSGSIQPGTSIRTRDKYRPRRVSAVRDFPPDCGPNTPVIKEVELAPGATMSAKEVELAPEATMSAKEATISAKEVELAPEAAMSAKEATISAKEVELAPEATMSAVSRRELVHGLMAAPYCPWRKPKVVSNSGFESSQQKVQKPNTFETKDDEDREVGVTSSGRPLRKQKTISISNGGSSGGRKRKQNPAWRQKSKAVARRSKPEMQSSGSSLKKKNKFHMSKDEDEEPDDEDDEDLATNSQTGRNRQDVEMNLLPHFGPKRSGCGDARFKVRETLRVFNAICRKLLQQEEAEPEGEEGKSTKPSRKVKRFDLATVRVVKQSNMLLNQTKMIGAVPGVEVGDEFQYRVELKVVGIHFPFQSGIDSMKVDDVLLATSIVASGAYFDDVENADVLRYSGQGGNIVGKSKKPEDQKLERGNLALKNSIAAKTPVRVVRGWKETKYVDPLDSRPKLITTYVYDGLYTVTDCSIVEGPHGKRVFMFELKRNPGQPELTWKELKRTTKAKMRPGLCVSDISEGKERIPIWAVNTINDEKPPPFKYISKMMYPDWYRPNPPKGCSCVGNCSARKKCKCALRNGGDIPYNHNGALVETKTLVYECGPHCTCPPSCYNRSTQRGIKFQLEIFKTESRGWGVRALTSITSGSFICEYTGELLEDKEAEERIGSDEYLFDIGQNLIDSPMNSEDQEAAAELKGGGFTIDALTYGNVGRFINHSCAPNLWAQNVIYDNDDMRMPHVMLFAMENIPPLTELTYSYNYTLGQIRDSEGNIKVKECYCGAVGCSGRLY